MKDAVTLREAARQAGVAPATLRRWAEGGVIPQYDGAWSPGAVAHARIVARLRERGHSLAAIREAGASGRLAYSFVEEMFPAATDGVTLEEAAAETGLAPALIERLYQAIGFTTKSLDVVTADDLQLLRYIAAVLSAGFPLVAFLQVVRVYGQALAQIADAEVRLFHLYVHEPLMRQGVPGVEMTAEMQGLARELLPLASPVMDEIHQRFLQHFVEQDVIGHMESDLEGDDLDLGRMRVAIAFADLAGYTRLTEELGEEAAVTIVERFVDAVEATLPDDARVIKTIGDEAMIVGSDVTRITAWAVGFQMLMSERPRPRIGIHVGETLYRDGDYYGREVNAAARVVARAAGGEVLVTRAVVDAVAGDLEFEPIGEVRLKGFTVPTELFLAHVADDA